MNGGEPSKIDEENLGRLIASSVTEPAAGFERGLVEAVLAEVGSQRRRTRAARLRKAGWALAAAAAVVVAVFTALSLRRGEPEQVVPQTVGLVKTLHGLVRLEDGGPAGTVSETQELHSGQWVETRSGSQAEVVLADESKLLVPPRTRLQVTGADGGRRVVLQRGALRVEAAKQPPGSPLTIHTPGCEIAVLGTKLEVHVVHKSDGSRQTRVSVTAGQVSLSAGGKRVLLLANMEGVADEGRPPVVRCLTAEVNAMHELIERNVSLAERAGVLPGRPAIIEFDGDGSATVWVVVPILRSSGQDAGSYSLKCRFPVGRIEAFSIRGTRLPVAREGDAWHIELAADPVPPAVQDEVIVKVTGLKGLFEAKGSGVFELHRPWSRSAPLSLIQFRLPGAAQVETLTPAPIETTRTLSRLVLTVAAHSEMPPLFE